MNEDREAKLIEEWVIRKLESGERPPWEARNKRERMWMEAWTIKEINELEDHEAREISEDPDWEELTRPTSEKETALREARSVERLHRASSKVCLSD